MFEPGNWRRRKRMKSGSTYRNAPYSTKALYASEHFQSAHVHLNAATRNLFGHSPPAYPASAYSRYMPDAR